MPWYNPSWWTLLSNKHFQLFFPIYGEGLSNLCNRTCYLEFANYQYYANNNPIYLNSSRLNSSIPATCSQDLKDLGWGLPDRDCAGFELVDCILGALPETAKADMQAAGLVLGLMPVILAMVGSTTAETGLLALRRPLLAAILGLASPAVNPIRTFDYNDSLMVLQRRIGLDGPPYLLARSRLYQNIIQYGFAIAALVNLITVTVSLTQRAIIGNDPNRDYQIMVWALWAFAIHTFGTTALMLRIRLQSEPETHNTSHNKSLMARILRFLNPITRIKNEFTPASLMPESTIVTRSGKLEGYLFLSLSWAVSIATIVHIVYGTFTFSNLLFLSGGEALGVLLRCLASVAVCRMVLMYELKAMGKKTKVVDNEPEPGPQIPLRPSILARQESSQYFLQDYTIPAVTPLDISYTRLVA